MRLFNFGRANRLSVCRIVGEPHLRTVGYWLSGRLFGWLISVTFDVPRRVPSPRRKRVS